jgi:hypothetical protein
MTTARLESCTSPISAEHIAQMEAQIRSRLGGLVRDVRVALREEGLVLQGRSRTHHARQIAQQVVMEATELPILANEIRV